MLGIDILNRLSYHLCVETNEQVRREAEETLNKIVDSDECLDNCLLLLDSGEPPYSVVVASSALRRLLNKKIGINLQQRMQLNRCLLLYLGKSVATMERYALNSLCKVFALLTKISWLDRSDSDILVFQESIPNLLTVAKEKSNEGFLALKLLTALVEEINSDEGLDTISKQRKIASDLRDSFLLEIFALSMEILKQSFTQQADTIAQKCVIQAVDLALACVNYDFVGSMNDDTLDENVNIQVPTKWRPVLIEQEVPKLFFDLYLSLPTEPVSKVFQILVQLASVRRMLFDATDRQKYLDFMITGLKTVFENPAKLEEPENFHNLCRMISRVKANYQVTELLKCTNFATVLSMLTDFTHQSLRTIEVLTTNSIYYLLSFWSRMSGSLNYARVDIEAIAQCIPEICSSFIESRMLLADAVVAENRDDPWDDVISLRQTMELFTFLCRRDYKKTVEMLINFFDQNMSILVNANAESQKPYAQKRLIWIITMVAAGVSGKSATSAVDPEEDLLDGEVVSRVWCLMGETDKRLGGLPTAADVQLEYAYLYLMEEFRKAYITDQPHRENRVYEKLGQVVGLTDDDAALVFYARKITTNLKYWGKSEKLLSKTLSLLNDLTVGYTNVRRLLKTEEIRYLLRNHSEFEFISSCTNIHVMRERTNYYAAIVRLLNIDLEENPSVFKLFIQPLTDEFTKLFNMFETGNCSNECQENIRFRIIGLCRDLRGIAMSCTKKFCYMLLLNWMLPKVFTVLHCAVQFWIDDADVTTPILKLLVEMTLNRQSRLNYEMGSCVSVILFREVSKIMCDYGNRFLALPEVPKDIYYKQRIKNIGVLCLIVRHVLTGNYLPFGVFWIYGDNCLNDAFDVLFKLFMRIHEQGILTYSKLSHSVYYLLDMVTRENMSYVSKLNKETFLAILKATQEGILSVDTTIISSSCTVLDQILDYLFERLSGASDQQVMIKEPEGNTCLEAVKENPDVLEKLLTSLLNQMMFEEVKCQWSMSRPLYGLLIACEEAYNKWRVEFIMRQNAAVRPMLEQIFDKFTSGMSKDVSMKNKDNFTQNLCTFRKQVEDAVKGTPSVMTDTDYTYGDNHMTD